MFAQIVDTPGRAKAATFFLSMPARSFHPEEVRKSLNESGASLAASLKHLVKNGLIKSFERNGELYYRINTRYPYLEELSGFLVKKNRDQFKDCVLSEFEKLNHTELVVLTGLFSGQLSMPTDVVVVGAPTPGILKRTIEKIEKEIRQEIYYTLFTPAEFEERVNMFERFTRDLFDNPHVIAMDKRVKSSRKIQTIAKRPVRSVRKRN